MNSCDTWHAAGTRGGRLVTLHSVELTWSQWTSVLTHNILANNIKVQHALTCLVIISLSLSF